MTQKVESLSADYLDFYRHNPPAWVEHSGNNLPIGKTLANWIEKAGKRGWHDHYGNMQPHPVAVKDHRKYFAGKMKESLPIPADEHTEVEDIEVAKLKQLDAQQLDKEHNFVWGAIELHKDQRLNGLRRIEMKYAAKLVEITHENNPKVLNDIEKALKAEKDFVEREDGILKSLEIQLARIAHEKKRRVVQSQPKKTRVPRVKFIYDSPEESAIGTSGTRNTKMLGGGINQSYIIELENGKKAIFKPAKGESKFGRYANIKTGTQFKREVAAYQLAKLLGLEKYVPITVLRKEKKYGLGSAQEFVDSFKYDEKTTEDLDKDALFDCAFFDAIIGNTDRHNHNWLMSKEKEMPVLIDNGLAFPNGDMPGYPRSVFVRYLQNIKLQKPSEDINLKHQETLQNLIAGEFRIRKVLGSLLEPEAIEGIFWRARKMAETKDYSLGVKWN